jgi:hypothetical protein
VIHLAAHEVYTPTLVRQRCAWCGAMLLEFDMAQARAALPVGASVTFVFWPVGHLVRHLDGEGVDPTRWIGSYRQALGDPPSGSCMTLDPAVTR